MQKIYTFILTIIFYSIIYSQSIPSCFDIVKTKTQPGVIPKCAPIRLPDSMAYEMLYGEFGKNKIKKINYNWYVFLTKNEKVNTATLWKLLVTVVSSVQTLYEENADVFIVVIPETESEAQLLLLGQYPSDKIKAYAKYFISDDLFNLDKRKNNYKRECFHRTYKLFVY